MTYEVEIEGEVYKIEIKEEKGSLIALINERPYRIEGIKMNKNTLSLFIDNKVYDVYFNIEKDNVNLCFSGKYFAARVSNERRVRRQKEKAGLVAGKQLICSIMPGKVIKILVDPGKEVQPDEGLVVIEAMKMENEVRSPIKGIVKEIYVKEGQAVDTGEKLVLVE